MPKIFKDLKEVNEIIEKQKSLNRCRQKIINTLMTKLLEEEKKNIKLKREVEEAKFVIQHLAMK